MAWRTRVESVCAAPERGVVILAVDPDRACVCRGGGTPAAVVDDAEDDTAVEGVDEEGVGRCQCAVMNV